MKKILVLGATGSIGTSALDIIKNHSNLFSLVGLSAHKNAEKLCSIAKNFNCTEICLSGENNSANFSSEIKQNIKYFGNEGLKNLIKNSDCDIVLNGIAGAAGLMPSITALECKKDLALANKETIVMAGLLVKKLAKQNNCRILPVDSEHSAIFSLIERYGKNSVDSVVITASGGPFKNLPKEKLQFVTLQDTLKHPTWDMGQKITIDSASLANKGLEVIEACRLFDLPAQNVHVTVHPQSLVHSFIRTKDGVLYAQISPPDMKHPILQALSWPDFIPNTLEQLDFSKLIEMSFDKPRFEDFPMLKLAYFAAEKSQKYTIAYNAANEIAVSAFINGKIGFLDIPKITEQVLKNDWTGEPENFSEIFEADKLARNFASEYILKIKENA